MIFQGTWFIRELAWTIQSSFINNFQYPATSALLFTLSVQNIRRNEEMLLIISSSLWNTFSLNLAEWFSFFFTYLITYFNTNIYMDIIIYIFDGRKFWRNFCFCPVILKSRLWVLPSWCDCILSPFLPLCVCLCVCVFKYVSRRD